MARKIRFIRAMGFFDAVMLGVGFIVGSGIYIMPVLAAQAAGAWSIAAWVVAGLYALLAGFCFAECAAIVPKTGGLYSYAHAALGDFWGFFAGYAFWFGYWLTIAVEQLALAWYLQFFIPGSENLRIAIACLAGFVFTFINYRGVKGGARMEDALTILKLLPLLLLVILGFFYFNSSNLLQPATSLPSGGIAFGFLSAVILALWAYQGAEIITVPEEEMKNARKIVPRAVLIASGSVIFIYVLVSIAVMGAVDWTKFTSSQAPLADIARALVGEPGGVILAVGGLISILGALNAVILASSRITFAMARDRLFPRFFNYLSPLHETPSRALWIHYFLALALTLVYRDFPTLAGVVVLFTIIPYLLSSVSALKLQKRFPNKGVLRSNKIPIVAIILSLGLAAYAISQNPLAFAGVMTFGLAFYALHRKTSRAPPRAPLAARKT
ncbi:amino acid permease [Candidatus Micrarchaeota archaeon]|nr:amino acid permease [Candidatus Micrarchaeota archaeon]